MKPIHQKTFLRLLLPVTLILVLAGCVSLYGKVPVYTSITTEHKQAFVLRSEFGGVYFPVGGMGAGGRKSANLGSIKLPKTFTLRWYDQIVHYSKYKNLKLHEYTVDIPKVLKANNEVNVSKGVKFLFTIKKDNTVTVKVSAY